jgi:hypothetical protein
VLPPTVKSPEIVSVAPLLAVDNKVPLVLVPIFTFAALKVEVPEIVTVYPPSIVTLSPLPGYPLEIAAPPDVSDHVEELVQLFDEIE